MKNQENQCKCIIFDCDNVLVDTETTFISVLMDMAEKYGVEMEADKALQLFSGRGINDTISILEQLSGQKFHPEFEQEFRRKTYEEFRKGVAPVDGVAELLSSLTIPFCVASSGPREKMALNLGLSELSGFFTEDTIFSCYDISKWKPDPAIFIHSAKYMGFQPSECVVIEDSIAGIQAAVDGGFKVYGLSNGFNQHTLAAHGAIVFEHMSELPQLIGLHIVSPR